MVGSASCNPVLEALLATHWDDRFFFDQWDETMMTTLLVQQELIQRRGQKREVLLLIDDVIMSSPAEDQLAHMCMRGRHFRVSVCMCAVSYTSLPKRAPLAGHPARLLLPDEGRHADTHVGVLPEPANGSQ